MMLTVKRITGVAMALTIAAFVLWLTTGRAVFTRYQMVDSTGSTSVEEDPLAATGFYSDQTAASPEVIDDFAFGLLPSSKAIFDRHFLSVVTLVVPIWIIATAGVWRVRRQRTA